MIIDIDFRYVKRLVPAPEWGENMSRPGLALQWRKKILDPSKSANPTWTDWQDVRTEEE